MLRARCAKVTWCSRSARATSRESAPSYSEFLAGERQERRTGREQSREVEASSPAAAARVVARAGVGWGGDDRHGLVDDGAARAAAAAVLPRAPGRNRRHPLPRCRSGAGGPAAVADGERV